MLNVDNVYLVFSFVRRDGGLAGDFECSTEQTSLNLQCKCTSVYIYKAWSLHIYNYEQCTCTCMCMT